MNCLLAILQCIFYTGNAAVPVLNFVETHCKHDLGSLITQVLLEFDLLFKRNLITNRGKRLQAAWIHYFKL